MVVVEVRQRTLCVEGRGWEDEEDDEEDDEEEDDEEEEEDEDEEDEEDEEEATDIKSNNPHLAGGEKNQTIEVKPLTICLTILTILTPKKHIK